MCTYLETTLHQVLFCNQEAAESRRPVGERQGHEVWAEQRAQPREGGSQEPRLYETAVWLGQAALGRRPCRPCTDCSLYPGDVDTCLYRPD